jgi:hypothetical protein
MFDCLFSALPFVEIVASAVRLPYNLISFHSRGFRNAMRWKALMIPTITDCSFHGPLLAPHTRFGSTETRLTR